MTRTLFALMGLFIVYGTTIPFRFDWGNGAATGPLGRINWFPLGGIPAGYDPMLADYVQNILLFLPFGFLGFLALAERGRFSGMVKILLTGSALSLFVEFVQMFSSARHPALTDWVLNTLGTGGGVAAGLFLRRWVHHAQAWKGVRRLLADPAAFPAAVFLGLVVVGAWEPFDFSLDVGAFGGKLRELLRNPFAFELPLGDLLTFARAVCLGLFATRLVKARTGHFHFLLFAVIAVAFSFALEGTQVFIQSRSPQFDDLMVLATGLIAGHGAAWLPPFRRLGLPFALGLTFFLVGAFLLRGLHPYVWIDAARPFHWVPFLPHYERTTFQVLGDFLQEFVGYFSLGFIWSYLFRGRRAALAASMMTAVAASAVIEFAQRYVSGRYADSTEIISAALGAWAGFLAWKHGRTAWAWYFHPEAGGRADGRV